MQDAPQQDEAFDLQDEFNYLTGRPTKAEIAQDEAERRAAVLESSKRAADASSGLAEADFHLQRIAADAAKLAVDAAKKSDSRLAAETRLEKLREKRAALVELSETAPEKVTGLVPGEGLGSETLPLDAVRNRTMQLLVELDIAIGDLEIAAPFAGIGDDEFGEYVEEPWKDETTGVEMSHVARATGLVGDLAREMEDATYERDRILRERVGDVTGITKQERKAREEEARRTLRVQDAEEKLTAARERLYQAREEVTRRNGLRAYDSHIERETQEIAKERAAKIDKREREKWEKAEPTEERAVALARLDVPMAERKGSKDKWREIVADAEETARVNFREGRLKRELRTSTLIADDPLMRFLKNGDRMDVSDFPDWREKSPAEAAALQRLGGVDDPHRTLERLRQQDEELARGGTFEFDPYRDRS